MNIYIYIYIVWATAIGLYRAHDMIPKWALPALLTN